MAFSENVNHLVHTVDNDLISIGALNTDDSEAIESMLPHGVTTVSLQNVQKVEWNIAITTAEQHKRNTAKGKRSMDGSKRTILKQITFG